MPGPHVQVVLGGPTLPAGLNAALRRVGATASFGPLSEVVRAGLKPTADAIVVVAPGTGHVDAQRGLQVLFDHVAARPRATLVLEPEGRLAHRPAIARALPIAFSAATDADDLAARLTTMMRLRPSTGTSAPPSKRRVRTDRAAARQRRPRLPLDSEVQWDPLPDAIPTCDAFSFATVYRPADGVSGDLCFVRRLDDDHVAVALIDPQGHGACAARLSGLLKRALIDGMPTGSYSTPLRPTEVLGRLNRELLESEPDDAPFAAAVYALLDLRRRRVALARAGAPYPILRRAGGRIRLLRPSGILLGVVPRPQFAVQTLDMRPGDSLILYSDGVEQVVQPGGIGTPEQTAPDAGSASATTADGRLASRLAAGLARARRLLGERARHAAPGETITLTRWFQQLRAGGTAAALEYVRWRHSLLRRLGRALDDLTVAAVSATA